MPHLSFLYPYQLKKGLRLEHAVIPVFQILMEAKNKSGVLRQISSMLLILFYFFPHCSAFLLHTILYGLTGSCSSFVPHYAVVLREPLRLFSFVFGVIRVCAASSVLHAARRLDLGLQRETLLFRCPSF